MSVPKKHKTSSARNRGRSHRALKKKQTIECPKCKKPMLPHRVCKNCGYYNGEEVIKIKTKLDKKKSKKEEKKESRDNARNKKKEAKQ